MTAAEAIALIDALRAMRAHKTQRRAGEAA